MLIHTLVPHSRLRRCAPGRPPLAALLGSDLAGWLDVLGRDGVAPPWPRVDVDDGEDAVVLTAELAGLSADDFEVVVEDDVLTIRGARRRAGEPASPRAARFARSFRLPFDLEADAVSARYRNGLLTVTVPHPGGPGSQVRTVPVTTG